MSFLHDTNKIERIVNIGFAVIISLLLGVFLVYVGNIVYEIRLFNEFREIFSNHFAIEIINQTNRPIVARWRIENATDEVHEIAVRPQETGTIVGYPAYRVYQLEMIYEEESADTRFIYESYPSALPEFTNQLVVKRDQSIKSQLVKNDRIRLVRYRENQRKE